MRRSNLSLGTLKSTLHRLLEYCQKNNWEGYDPYDALNSRLVKALPFLNVPVTRLVLSQVVKRIPINPRPILLIPRTPSTKGLALFLSALTELDAIGMVGYNDTISELAARLLALRSPESDYSCWGYTFDWETRKGLVPKGSPNIICSTFAANALLDAYERYPYVPWLRAAESTARFIYDVLLWRDEDSNARFSYHMLGRTRIHNANLLGAALLCRVGRIMQDDRLIKAALEATRFSVNCQRRDGSWPYGEDFEFQGWIDNFHSGFNLVALKQIQRFAGTQEFDESIRLGFAFYRNSFFRTDWAPKYYHNSVYPIDIHCVAQSIITFVELNNLAEGNMKSAQSVLEWALKHMWNKRGYFYFQKHRLYTIRIPYMRWAQAWMLLALSTLLKGMTLETPKIEL